MEPLIDDAHTQPHGAEVATLRVLPRAEGTHPPLGIYPAAILVGIGLFALIVYVAFLYVLPKQWTQNQSSDYSGFYEPVARNIVRGRGFVNSDGSVALRFPPGFSLVLASLFAGVRSNPSLEPAALRLAIGLVVMIAPIIIFWIAHLVFERNISILAGLLCCTYPFYLWLTKQPNSEIPFLLFLLPGFYFLAKSIEFPRPSAWHAVLIGALMGLASLTRPIAIALSCVLVTGMWLLIVKWTRRQRLIFSGLVLFTNFLVVLPWELWVEQRTGQWILLSTGGPPSVVDGLTFAANSPVHGGPAFVSSDIKGLMQETSAQKDRLLTIPSIAAYLTKKCVSEPTALIKLVLLKAARSWYADDVQSQERWILLLQAPYLLLAGIGASIACRMGPAQRRFTYMIALLVCYFWLMTIVSLSILRYMVPAILLLMPLVALGLVRIQHMLGHQIGRLRFRNSLTVS
jgi:4-amino-4-deoxy-L-arabinose transferase-like glycosyltransferase